MNGIGQIEKHKKIICPFHTDTHPSMSWFEEGLLWKCMSCEETMDIYRYYQEFENMNFVEALNTVAGLVGEVVDKSYKKKVYASATEKYTEPTDELIEIFGKRGITKETISGWNIQQSKKWAVFQYKDEKGKVVFNTFRNLYKKECLREKDTKEILWGMDNIDITKPVICVEGQFDAMVVWQCGYRNVVSIPSGITALAWIENCWSWLQKITSFVIWCDNDEAGIRGAHEIRNRLGKEKTVIDFHPNYKDANDMLLLAGETEVKDFIEDLISTRTDGIVNMGRRKDDITGTEGFSIGFPELDKYFRNLKYGEFTLVFGRDNEGKSTFVSQVIANVLEREKVFLYSGELNETKIELWIMCQLTGKNSNYTTKIVNEWGEEEIIIRPDVKKAIKKWYADRFYAYETKMSLDNQNHIFQVMEEGYKRHGIRVFVIDNMFSALDASSKETTVKETEFVKRCKNFALTYNVHVILVAHPNKGGSIEHEALSKVHVSGSKNITNGVDNIIAVERVWELNNETLDEDYRRKTPDGRMTYTSIVRCLKARLPRMRENKFFLFDSQTLRMYNEVTSSNPSCAWKKYLPETVTYYNGTTQTFTNSEMENPFEVER